MKRLRVFPVIVTFTLLVGVFGLYTGCEGPEGPEGPAGPAGETGPAGLSASEQCGTCHNVSTVILAKQIQYQSSTHAMGSAYVRGSSASCAPCHSSEGFRLKIAGSEVVGIDDPTPVNCRTCHNIHMQYTTDDFELSTTVAVELTGIMYNGDTVDLGDGNLCINCHQTRPRDYGLEVGGGDVTISSSHWGPHHGTQGNVYTGSGGFEIAGSMAYANSGHVTSIEDGCVTCHVTSHTFEPSTSVCSTCHSGLKDFDYNGVQTEVAALLEELAGKLLADGILAEENGEYHPVTDITISSSKAGALLNFFMIVDDGSHGVHNAKYTKALLQNSIEVF